MWIPTLHFYYIACIFIYLAQSISQLVVVLVSFRIEPIIIAFANKLCSVLLRSEATEKIAVGFLPSSSIISKTLLEALASVNDATQTSATKSREISSAVNVTVSRKEQSSGSCGSWKYNRKKQQKSAVENNKFASNNITSY
jgi:hypothetical protein